MSQTQDSSFKDRLIAAGVHFPKAVETYFKAFEMAAIVGALLFAADKIGSWELKIAAAVSFITFMIWVGWMISSAFPNPLLVRRQFKNKYLTGAAYLVLIGLGSAFCAQFATRVAFGVIGAFMK